MAAYIVAIGLSIFAFTTILGWSYYCEKCEEYLLGVRAIVLRATRGLSSGARRSQATVPV